MLNYEMYSKGHHGPTSCKSEEAALTFTTSQDTALDMTMFTLAFSSPRDSAEKDGDGNIMITVIQRKISQYSLKDST